MAMERGKKISISNSYTQKSIGLDPGFGSSNFGVCITELVDGMVKCTACRRIPQARFQ